MSSGRCPGSTLQRRPSRFAAAAGCRVHLVQQRCHFFLDGDDRLRLIQTAAQSGILRVGLGEFGLQRVRRNLFRTARAGLQRAQSAGSALTPPVAQSRGIQALTPQNG